MWPSWRAFVCRRIPMKFHGKAFKAGARLPTWGHIAPVHTITNLKEVKAISHRLAWLILVVLRS